MGKLSKKYKLGEPTSRICARLEETGVFDHVFYKGPSGCQPGAYVELRKGEYEALLRREKPSPSGYNGSFETPTRIAYLVIDMGKKCYGFFDPNEMIQSPRHKFEKDAERDSNLKSFLDNILKNFN
jgi:hypothetical protein